MTTLSQYTHNTVPTQFVEADGIRFAYRRFGRPDTAAPPLVLVQHFRGNLDNHDSAITDRLAQDREVILFDNTGVGQSTGQAPDTIEGMARDAAAFVDALGLDTIDIFGHSMGGHVSQQLLVDRPELIRRAALVDTGPPPGSGGHRRTAATTTCRPSSSQSSSSTVSPTLSSRRSTPTSSSSTCPMPS
jgi:pimeloyl-ACP methyl ester carboxylesterase